MKVVQLNFRRVCSCLTFLIGFIKNILFRRRQRKLSHGENERLPTSVMVTSSNAGNATEQAVGSDEWTEWGQMEEFSVRVEPSSSLTQEQLPANDDLFHDMTPVFQKPKKVTDKNIDLLLTKQEGCTREYWPEVVAVWAEVHTKATEVKYSPVRSHASEILVKKKKPFSDGSNAVEAESPSSRLKFDVAYPPAEPELGTWAEESTAWEEDGVSEIDIELQTEKLKKERKQAERERRAMEQQKKREEREAHKIQKPQGHFGVRIAT